MAKVVTAQDQTKTDKNDSDAYSDEETCSQNKVGPLGCLCCSFLVVCCCLMGFDLCVDREKIMTTPRRDKKRESRREEKAIKAAVLDKVTTIYLSILWCFDVSFSFVHNT